MTSYLITARWEPKGTGYVPILWFVPATRDMFSKTTTSSVEAPTARDAVITFMGRHDVNVAPDQPVRGSPLQHRWLLPARVTIGVYVEEFLDGRHRALMFRVRDGVRCRILSVQEQAAPVGVEAGRGASER